MISAALSVLKTDEERNIVEKLYTENRNRFLSIAYSRLDNRANAEEAVQDALRRSWTLFLKYPTAKSRVRGYRDTERRNRNCA